MYLGLDLGTSGIKALVVDDKQQLVDEATAPLEVLRPHPGWSEQRPADWISAASTVMDMLAARGSLKGLRGIGLSGQMHGATLLDKSDNVLRNCILWNDTRAHAEAAQLDANPVFRAQSGNIVFPGFTAPKILWVEANESEIRAKLARVLLPKDYLRLWLTGNHVSDLSDAAGTAWLDPGKRDWSDALLAACGLTRDHMPDLAEGSAPTGVLRPEIAARWGLARDVIVGGGGGDNAASAVGVGVVKAGQAFVSLGTSGVLFAASDSYSPDAGSSVHTFCHALPKLWHQMGVILSATDSLNWYAGLVGADPAELTGNLGALQAPGRALFLPYLGGERTPHNDARVRGALVGLAHDTDRTAGTRAVLEGVSFALKDCHDALSATGTRIDSLVAVGGGSRSRHWLEMIATVLGQPVSIPEAGDYGAAFGAARLGLMAATGAGAEVATPPRLAATIDPVPALSEAFAQAHARYKSTYTALKDLS
ncbi:xylulokinase [Fluviibacterium sp. S390]|uniref:xylulokinase n=1 Tax=Fluviibacterium sp. S390 TaxID=3415139 RepID=UPI003C79E001